MSDDNRISAVMTEGDVRAVHLAVMSIRSVLPFLITLSAQERRELPKMGPKSVGFDEKCVTYMANRPEFIPGFVLQSEVNKDRALRARLLEFSAELQTLANSVDDTLLVISSEVWMADLAYYQTAREAARRGRDGAQDVYNDLSGRFPTYGKTASAETPEEPGNQHSGTPAA